MPLTEKDKKILAAMRETYASEKKAKEVFYASAKAGKLGKDVQRRHGPKKG